MCRDGDAMCRDGDAMCRDGDAMCRDGDALCRDANLGPQVRCHRLGGGWGRQSGDVPSPAGASFPVSRLCFAGLTPGTASAAPLHRPQPAHMQEVYGEMMHAVNHSVAVAVFDVQA